MTLEGLRSSNIIRPHFKNFLGQSHQQTGISRHGTILMQEHQEQFQLLHTQVGDTLEQPLPSHQFLHHSQHILGVLTLQHRHQSLCMLKLIQQSVMLSQLHLLGLHNQVIPCRRFLSLPSVEIPKMRRPQHSLLSMLHWGNSPKRTGLSLLVLFTLLHLLLASIDHPIGGPNHSR